MKNIWKKLAAGALVCMLTVVTMAQPILAAVDNGTAYPIDSNSVANWPQMGDMFSETAVLMDADTGAVLVNKGMDAQRYPASITKVMTALLALENTKLDDQVTFTEAGLARMVEGTNIDTQVGEVMTMEQCLNILLMVSANEVAAQIAIQVAGSEEAFAQKMNERAAAIGCKNTHFNNASGLPDENHYTTAYDMALIFREAYKNEDFKKIIESRTYTLPATNMHEARAFNTHLALVVPSAPEYYEPCIGGKTGITQAALNTLVTAAEKDGKTLIAVTLRADAGQVCADTKALYEYGFNNFTKLELDGGSAMVPNNVTQADLLPRAVDKDGETVNDYYYGEQYVGTAVPTVDTQEDTEDETTQDGGETEDSQETAVPAAKTSNPLLDHKGFAVGAGALCGLIILGFIMIIVSLFTRRR